MSPIRIIDKRSVSVRQFHGRKLEYVATVMRIFFLYDRERYYNQTTLYCITVRDSSTLNCYCLFHKNVRMRLFY